MAFSSAYDALAMARWVVAKRTPYFTSAILTLALRPCNQIPTIGVTDGGVLLFNEAFTMSLDADELSGVLVHEILHIVHGHLRRMQGPEWDKTRANQAMDLAINDSVIAMGYKLPKDGLFPANFKFPPNLSAEEYYDLLSKLKKKPKIGGVGSGDCGSCTTGKSSPGEPGPGDEANRSSAEIARVVRATAEQVRQAHAKNPGNVPADLLVWADKALTPPKVRWQEKLARYARAKVAAATSGATDYSYRRPNRQSAWDPDAPIRPSMVGSLPRVALVVDTSGSMLGGDLERAVSEARGILSACGAGVTFVSCDADVHGAVKRVRTFGELAKGLQGGGGTDFRPAFLALTKNKYDRPSVIVYATDGYGPAPEHEVIPTIWLLTRADSPAPAKWGAVIRLVD